jgi:hypothetical protein
MALHLHSALAAAAKKVRGNIMVQLFTNTND